VAIGKEGRDEHLSQNPAARFRIGHVQWDSRGGTRKCRARRRPIPHPANWPRDFAAAIKAAGKSVELIEAPTTTIMKWASHSETRTAPAAVSRSR